MTRVSVASIVYQAAMDKESMPQDGLEIGPDGGTATGVDLQMYPQKKRTILRDPIVRYKWMKAGKRGRGKIFVAILYSANLKLINA